MSAKQRNYYQILQVQPEAQPEVIKASRRALMHTMRGHPDLGGDPDEAALVNEAYAVLSDPDRRRAYDGMLELAALHSKARSPVTGAGPRSATRRVDPSAWRADHVCPMCCAPLRPTPGRDPRCTRCDAPLTRPLGTPKTQWGTERRAAVRRPRSDAAAMITDWRGVAIDARMIDLSVGGSGLLTATSVTPGGAVRIVTRSVDGVAKVAACQQSGSHWRLRTEWLTVKLLGIQSIAPRPAG